MKAETMFTQTSARLGKRSFSKFMVIVIPLNQMKLAVITPMMNGQTWLSASVPRNAPSISEPSISACGLAHDTITAVSIAFFIVMAFCCVFNCTELAPRRMPYPNEQDIQKSPTEAIIHGIVKNIQILHTDWRNKCKPNHHALQNCHHSFHSPSSLLSSIQEIQSRHYLNR